MDYPGGDDHIERFVPALLCTGRMLSELVSELIEGLPTDSYSGEEPAASATALIDPAAARTFEHLRLACDLSRRVHGGGGPHRMHG